MKARSLDSESVLAIIGKLLDRDANEVDLLAWEAISDLVLSYFSLDESEEIRAMVCENKGAPDWVLRQAFKLGVDPIGREVLAGHPNCPTDLIEQLAMDEDWTVRQVVAKRPDCPIEALKQMISINDFTIDELLALTKHSSQTIREAALDAIATD